MRALASRIDRSWNRRRSDCYFTGAQSMLLHSFACPHCDRHLKSADGVEEGKKLKCPQCEKIFAAAAEETAAEEAVPVRKRKAAHDDEGDEAPRRKKIARNRASEGEKDEDALRHKKSERSRADDEDDRPLRKKQKAKKQNAGLVALRISLGAIAVAAIAWAGWQIYQKRVVGVVRQEDAGVAPPQSFPIVPPQPLPKAPMPAVAFNPERHMGPGRVFIQQERFSIVPPKDWVKAKKMGSRSFPIRLRT